MTLKSMDDAPYETLTTFPSKGPSFFPISRFNQPAVISVLPFCIQCVVV